MSVPALVQAVASQGTGLASGTLGATPTQGNLLVICRAILTNDSNVGADSFGGTLAKLRDFSVIAAPNAGLWVYYKIAGASEPTSFTIARGGAVAGQKLMEFSGIDPITPFRTSVNGDIKDQGLTYSSAQCGSLTPVAGELLLACMGSNGNGPGESSSTIDSSYTLIQHVASNASSVGYRIAPNTTPINPTITWTYANSPDLTGFHLAFNAAPNPASDRQIPRGSFRGLTRGVS